MTYEQVPFRFQDDRGVWWQRQTEQNPFVDHSLQKSGSTFRFEVREGEHPEFDDDRDGTADANERSIIYQTQGNTFVPLAISSAEWWFSGTLNIITDEPNTAAYCNLLSVSAVTLDPGETVVTGMLYVRLNSDNELQIQTATTTANPRPGIPDPDTHYTDPAFPRGEPVKFIFCLRRDWRPGGSGGLTAWRDGQQIVDYRGPVGFDDLVGPNLRIGIYRATRPTPFIIEWDDVRTGATASDVDAFPSSPPRRRYPRSDYGAIKLSRGAASYK